MNISGAGIGLLVFFVTASAVLSPWFLIGLGLVTLMLVMGAR